MQAGKSVVASPSELKLAQLAGSGSLLLVAGVYANETSPDSKRARQSARQSARAASLRVTSQSAGLLVSQPASRPALVQARLTRFEIRLLGRCDESPPPPPPPQTSQSVGSRGAPARPEEPRFARSLVAINQAA